MQDSYLPRLADPVLAQLLTELPAIMLTGPRATGKTSTAARFASSVVRLDQPAQAAAFVADPDAALAAKPEPVLLDEWQVVPEILGAVKRAVDANSSPGRFLLTGSARGDLDAVTWPGTGRIVRLSVYGMTIRELQRLPAAKAFVERAVDPANLLLPAAKPDLVGYVEAALKGGFPEPAIRLQQRARNRWLNGYLDQLLTRDAEGVDSGRDPARLRRFFEVLAMNTAGIVADTTLSVPAGVTRRTAVAYEALLTNLFVTEALPAWTSNRTKRLTLRPKRFLVDAALAGAALGLDAGDVLGDGDILGRILETFVASQLRAEQILMDRPARLYHLRTEKGRQEIDIVVELPGRGLLAIEVKASAAPDARAARHLAWLRDEIGSEFLQGIVLHTGPGLYTLGDRLTAVPICAIWG